MAGPHDGAALQPGLGDAAARHRRERLSRLEPPDSIRQESDFQGILSFGQSEGTATASLAATSLTGHVLGNLMSEFWPEVQEKFFREKSKN
ncbi:hypothetical protein SBA6_1110010 [Candidatus Sulfopaludibacter sp. SbA6]|nr:hypothetical protein SBA6_1110010 [Candidatus Sulfopaludibacter sp. SbA6]